MRKVLQIGYIVDLRRKAAGQSRAAMSARLSLAPLFCALVLLLSFIALPVTAEEPVWKLTASNPFIPRSYNCVYARNAAAASPMRPSFIKIVGTDSIDANHGVERFCSEALDVNFRVNRTNIDTNSESYRRLIQEGVPFIRQHGLVFHHLEVRGGASPEGAYWNNERLARQRAQALVDTLGHYVQLPEDQQFDIVTIPEDYEYLAILIARSDDPEKEAILDVIDRYRGDDLATKDALRRLNGGTTWYRLLTNYFPQLRSARVIFYFVSLDAAPIKGPVANPALPTTLPPMTSIYYKLLFPTQREPMLSVKTNLLYDLFFVPGVAFDPVLNVEVEYYPRNSKWSILGEYEFPWWSDDEGMRPDSKHHYFQALNGQLEVRRYFAFNAGNEERALRHTGHYLSAYAGINMYDFCFDSKHGEGVQGEGRGFGLGYGYVLPLGGLDSRWKLEFLVKAGYYVTLYDPYTYMPNYDPTTHEFLYGRYYYDWAGLSKDFIRRNYRFRWLGPTGVGVTLSYDLLDRKVKFK